MSYFSKYMSLKEISSQIYGMSKNIARFDRPHMFIKELDLYINYISDKLAESSNDFNKKQAKYFDKFLNNLNDGIFYYTDLFGGVQTKFSQSKENMFKDLDVFRKKLSTLTQKVDALISDI